MKWGLLKVNPHFFFKAFRLLLNLKKDVSYF